MKKGKCGGGSGTKSASKSVVESKIVINLAQLTDDKSLFRQWDGKLSNALAHVNQGYSSAPEKMKDGLDQGQDPEEEISGADVGPGEESVDTEQLPSDLELIHCRTHEQIADALTKPLNVDKFAAFRFA